MLAFSARGVIACGFGAPGENGLASRGTDASTDGASFGRELPPPSPDGAIASDSDASGHDGATGGRDAGYEAMTDASDAGGAPNLHPQGTFENGTCDPWGSFQGSVHASDVGHSGGGSCEVCTLPTTVDRFTADDNGAPGPSVAGATYHAEGWARTSPGKAPPGLVDLNLRNVTPEPIEQTRSAQSLVNDVWQRFETTLAVTKPNGRIGVYISGEHRPNACFLIDDVVLSRVQ